MRFLALSLLGLAVLAPLASAEPEAQDCAAPCGWVNPLINLDFPDKPKCGAGQAAGNLDRSQCFALPALGDSVVLEGKLIWYWDMTNEGTYPNDPLTDIQVSFAGTASNPAWMEAKVEPEGFTIGTADLFNPTNFKVDQTDPTQNRVFFWFERPITLAITRTGDPTPQDLERAEARDGVLPFFVKAKSTESSDRYKAAFGVEEVRFDTLADPAFTDAEAATPAPGLALVAAAVAAAALIRRRR